MVSSEGAAADVTFSRGLPQKWKLRLEQFSGEKVSACVDGAKKWTGRELPTILAVYKLCQINITSTTRDCSRS